jgi:uncharacterized membrane protein
MPAQGEAQCAGCGLSSSQTQLLPAPVHLLRSLGDKALKPGTCLCRSCLTRLHRELIQELMGKAEQELDSHEHEVMQSLLANAPISAPLESDDLAPRWADRLSDRIARFGGSWGFLISFGLFLLVWIMLNSLLHKPFDPFPFILLNLALSCLAAIQAPVILMSQNRQEARDRLRGINDYQVNLKAELEIRQLHLKLDQLLWHHWQQLTALQELQLVLLEDILAQLPEPLAGEGPAP